MLAAVAAGFHPTARAAAEAMGGTGREFVPGPNAVRYAALFEEVFAGVYPSLRHALSRLAAFRHADEVTSPDDPAGLQ
jgi:ribulose kinase